MHKLSRSRAHELDIILGLLEIQLDQLDELGAGIAAIHVDAAIGQLRENIATLGKTMVQEVDPDMLVISPLG